MVLRASLLLIFSNLHVHWTEFVNQYLLHTFQSHFLVLQFFENLATCEVKKINRGYRFVCCAVKQSIMSNGKLKMREEMSVQAQAKGPAKRPISWLLLGLAAKREDATTYKCVCVCALVYACMCVSNTKFSDSQFCVGCVRVCVSVSVTCLQLSL